MGIRVESRISRAPMAALAAVGVFWGGFAAYVPDIKAAAGASDRDFGLALILSAVGGIVAMTLAPRYSARAGRIALPLAGALLVPAFALPLFGHSVPTLALALFGMGAAVSLLDITANVRISNLEARHGLHLMNLNHAMFSFAFAAAALFASLLRRAGQGPEVALPLLAVAGVALAFAMVERDWQAAPEAPHDADHRAPWGVILPAAAILFAAFISENATEAWSALHIERTLGGPAGDGGFGPMMLGLTMGVGRMSGQIAARRLGEVALVFWSSCVGVAGALVIAAAFAPWVAVLGVGLVGMGVAVVVPSANSILGHLVRPDQRAFAISRAWMIGFTGFFFGPSAMGMIAQLANLRVAFVAVALMLASIALSVTLLGRKGRKDQPPAEAAAG